MHQTNKLKRRPRIAAILIMTLLLSSCSGLVQNLQQERDSNRQNRTAQLMRIAEATRKGGDLNAALALYLRASNLSPEKLPPLKAAGNTAYRLGLYNQALKAYEKAVVIAPKDIASHTGYGKALIALGQAQDAQNHFRTVIKLAPTDYRGYNGLGVALDILGRHAQARRQYRRGLAVSPNTIALLNNLALSLAISEKFKQSLAILTPYRNDPRAGALLRQNLALIYGLSGQTDKAAEMASRDLNKKDVANNLKYYRRLRALTKSRRTEALIPKITIPKTAGPKTAE